MATLVVELSFELFMQGTVSEKIRPAPAPDRWARRSMVSGPVIIHQPVRAIDSLLPTPAIRHTGAGSLSSETPTSTDTLIIRPSAGHRTFGVAAMVVRTGDRTRRNVASALTGGPTVRGV